VFEKSLNPFLKYIVLVRKIMYIEIKKQLYLVPETSTAFSDGCIHSPLPHLMQPNEWFLCYGNGSPRHTVGLFGIGESGKRSLNSLWNVK
jgi:hypothetical protein